VLAGCASSPSPRKATTEPQVARPSVEAQVVQEPGGFTITQPVSLPGEVRSDYVAAVRLLKQEKYEPGIALLLKVTERAPELTAANNDLGIAIAGSEEP